MGGTVTTLPQRTPGRYRQSGTHMVLWRYIFVSGVGCTGLAGSDCHDAAMSADDVQITRPADPPFRYVVGGWPHGEVRPLPDAEGGELVRWQLDQLRMFVAELIERREARGVSQAALSRLTGLRRNTISELESGQSYPDWSTISRLAWALEADVRFVGRRAERIDEVAPRSAATSGADRTPIE